MSRLLLGLLLLVMAPTVMAVSVTVLRLKPIKQGVVLQLQSKAVLPKPTIHQEHDHTQVCLPDGATIAPIWRYKMAVEAHAIKTIIGSAHCLTIATSKPLFPAVNPSHNGWSIVLSQQSPEKMVSLNVAGADVKQLILQLARHGHHNIIISPQVSGKITIHLDKVSWQQALSAILRSQNLLMVMHDNITMIGPAPQLIKQQEQWQSSAEKLAAVAPTTTHYFHLHYVLAKTLAKEITQAKQRYLTVQGGVSVDERTNTLAVFDTAPAVKRVVDLVKQIDRPVPAVHIAARLVLVDQSALHELGVLLHQQGDASGGLGSVGKLSVNAPLADAAGVLGVSLGTLPGGAWLDWELQALEMQGQGEIIASPELTVNNLHEASIEQGDDVPFQVSAGSSGATSIQFKKAVLGLNVTPHISSDGYVVLKLKVNKDSVTKQKGTAGDVPIVATSVIQTTVRVKSGRTAVLGGIKLSQLSDTKRQVPILGDLPVLGSLFRSHSQSYKTSELLIFITPTVIKSGV